MKTILKNTAILLAITLVAGIALSFVYELTKGPIEAAELAAKAEAYRSVYAEADSFDTVEGIDATLEQYNASLPVRAAVEEVLAAKDAAGSQLGYVMTVVSYAGYGGEIRLALALDTAGTVVGYDVLAHGESPGFGANCVNEDVRQQFIGVTAADQIDGITGATITSDALREATQTAIDLVRQLGEK